MNQKTFDEMIDWLEAEKSYDMSEHAKTVYWDAFRESSDEKFRAAIKSVAVEVRKFPTIGEIRREMLKKEDRGGRRAVSIHTHQGSAMARETSELIRRLDLRTGEPNKLTPEQYLDELRLMDEKYPGLGWAEQANSYERTLRMIAARKEKEKDGQDRRTGSDS